jgi:DNA-binding NarL/FixJ family response regulator
LAIYREALNSGHRFDAVIMDLTIQGGMGGKETMKALLGIDPAVKGIVSSGYNNDPILAHFREFGFSGMVSKPYTVRELQSGCSDPASERSFFLEIIDDTPWLCYCR